MAIHSIQPILDLDQEDLAPYRTMKRDGQHRKQRIFVAEGDKVVERLLDSHFEVLSILLPLKWLEILRPRIEARPEAIKVFTAERKSLESMTNFSMYQGVLAVGRVPATLSVPTLMETAPPPRLFAAVEDLTNAENLGGMVRNCAGMGVQALVVGESCISPFLRRAVRSSMGAIFKLPVVESPNLAHSLMEIRQRGVRIIAAHPHAAHTTLSEARLESDCCILFGSEGFGISPTLLDLADEWVAIPMRNDVDSLNVASASAAFLYEAARQQQKV